MDTVSFSKMTKDSLAALPVKKKCCLNMQNSALELSKVHDARARAERISAASEDEKCTTCLSHYLRGLFILYGSVTDPSKQYHLELSFDTEDEMKAAETLLNDAGMSPRTTTRKKKHIVYFKSSEEIFDFLALVGANIQAFDLMNKKIEKDIRNNTNRMVNCDTANIIKAVSAAETYVEAIKKLQESGDINKLSAELKQTALLRLDNDQLTLSQLGAIHEPPISKSGVKHRLDKIIEAAVKIK